MPHLSRLQARYGKRGLTVIGVTQTDKWGCNPTSVQEVLHDLGRRANYSIGIDKPASKAYLGVFGGQTECAYLQAANAMEIPTAFLVDQRGEVAYIGWPSLVDSTLDKVMNGKLDLNAAAIAYGKAKQDEGLLRQYTGLMQRHRYSEAYTLGHQIENADGDPRILWFIAADILDPAFKEQSNPDLQLALSCALKAVDACRREDPGMLATLARVHKSLGDRKAAQDVMREAIGKSFGSQKKTLIAQAKDFDN
jgi:hypothetical protein